MLMSDQVDIAVDLGVLPPPLPENLNLRQLVEVAPAAPPQGMMRRMPLRYLVATKGNAISQRKLRGL